MVKGDDQTPLAKRPRKTVTRSAVKNRWNRRHYKSFSTQVKPELAERIAAYRKKEGLSTSQFLERAIDTLEVVGSHEEGR